jgi:superfamily II DNA or RNA helicase
VQDLFEAIRAASSSGTWSRGVELVRAEAVSLEEESAEESSLRVSTRGGMISFVVTLHPAEREWSCECTSPDDPCEHVAAAAIALRRAQSEGKPLPGPAGSGAPSTSGAGRLRYHLSRCGSGLALERSVVRGGHEEPLVTTLSSVASGRVEGPRFVATNADLAVERVLGARLRGPLARESALRLVAALAECADVRLDGVPVRACAEPLVPHGRLEDDENGFRLSVVPDPSITETFANGVALCGDVLRPVGESGLTGRELAELPRGKHFSPDDALSLVTEILPDLERRIPVEIRTSRLPRTARVPPRLVVETAREGEALSVLVTLVYGDPPAARVDAGRLTLLPGSGAAPLRDEAAEARLVRQLQNQLELLPGRRVVLRGEEALALAGKLASFGGEVRGRGHEAFFRAAPLVPELRADGEDFELRFVSRGDECPAKRQGEVSAERVLAAWRSGESFVALSGGGMAPLPADWLARFGERVADLLSAKQETKRLPRAALPDLARLCEDLAVPPPPFARALESLVHGFEGIREVPLPEDLTAELRSYQKSGVAWLCFLRDAGLGAVLADDMGLGKTLQALCALRGRTLVVAPTSVLHNWAAEIARFRPALRATLHHGARRALDESADVTLTSYAILRLDAELLSSVDWDTVVLDEAQNVKNPASQAAQAAFRLRAGFRLAMTGTPIENRLDELWSQLHFTNPGFLGSLGDFSERYVKPIAEGGPRGEEAAERLRQRIRPFILRRRKREVTPELPPRTDLVLRCELDGEERAVYDAVRAATRTEVLEKLRSGESVLSALEALLRLRQAACHRALVPGQSAPSSSKILLLQEELESVVADGHKALVFSQWTSLLDLVEPCLRAAGIHYSRLDGSTVDRSGVVAGFQSEAGPPVLLVSLRAGGTGLNLTQADHVFLLDPWWNPAVEDQAADRAHRIGQERPVIVYRLVAADTVEEGILRLQERKRALTDAALGGTEGTAALSRADLLALLE